MAFDYRKLLGRIVEKYGTQACFSEAIGMSERSLSLKLNCKIEFKQKEILKACEALDIADGAISEYFFTQKVQAC